MAWSDELGHFLVTEPLSIEKAVAVRRENFDRVGHTVCPRLMVHGCHQPQFRARTEPTSQRPRHSPPVRVEHGQHRHRNVGLDFLFGILTNSYAHSLRSTLATGEKKFTIQRRPPRRTAITRTDHPINPPHPRRPFSSAAAATAFHPYSRTHTNTYTHLSLIPS